MLNNPIILSLSKYNGELKNEHEITLFCENLENYIDDTNNMSIFLNNERINEIVLNEKINEINVTLPKKEKPEIVKLMVVVNDDIFKFNLVVTTAVVAAVIFEPIVTPETPAIAPAPPIDMSILPPSVWLTIIVEDKVKVYPLLTFKVPDVPLKFKEVQE